jgi:hypothetical protein
VPARGSNKMQINWKNLFSKFYSWELTPDLHLSALVCGNPLFDYGNHAR